MGWNIHPGSARAICDQADENIDGLNPVAEKVSSAFDAVAASAGTQTASAAHDVSLDPFLTQLYALKEYVKSATSDTRSAIDAYEAGDLEMAADFQQEASGIE